MSKNKTSVFTLILIVGVFLFASGNSYSQVTDKDGKEYKTVTIGTREWTVENLSVEHYRNGDPIPQVQDEKEWKKLTTGAWCYYENKTENGTTYGKLYNWYAVNDSRGLAPEGWHVPTDAEWTDLAEYLGGKDIAGGKMKATILWASPNKEATNESGFTGLPGGYFEEGRFKHIEKYGCFWSSTEVTTIGAWCRQLKYNIPDIQRDNNHKRNGLSVRCVKD